MRAVRPRDDVMAEGGDPQDCHETLREIHHQVRNSLQVVCSLLRLQSRPLQDPTARAAFKRTEERIQSMALVYETLYRSGSMFEVPFHEYVRDLATQVSRNKLEGSGNLTVVSDLEPIFINSKAATTCGLILSELLAMRVAARNEELLGGVLKLALFSEGQAVVIELDDTGPAWSEMTETPSLSMQILQALVSQLKGTIEFGVPGEAGCRLSFPQAELAGE